MPIIATHAVHCHSIHWVECRISLVFWLSLSVLNELPIMILHRIYACK